MGRKLGESQRSVLLTAEYAGDLGVNKGLLLGRLWAVVDRLCKMGLLEERFIQDKGPVYFINDAGRSAIANQNKKTAPPPRE